MVIRTSASVTEEDLLGVEGEAEDFQAESSALPELDQW